MSVCWGGILERERPQDDTTPMSYSKSTELCFFIVKAVNKINGWVNEASNRICTDNLVGNSQRKSLCGCGP